MDVPTTVPLGRRQQILSEAGDRFSADKNDLRDIIYMNVQNFLTNLWDFQRKPSKHRIRNKVLTWVGIKVNSFKESETTIRVPQSVCT